MVSLISEIHDDLEKGVLRLMTEYRARLFVDAVRLCEDNAAAEDLVSRTFSKAIFNLDSYKEDDNLYGWMKTIMVNIHRNDLARPVARGTTPVSSDALEMYAGADNGTDEQILKNSDHDVLREAIDQLEPEYRKMVSMYYYNELSLKEIASFFQTSTSSVSRKLEIARKIIAAKVGNQIGKKPVAILLAVFLGIGMLWGAWVSPLGDWAAEKVFGSAPAAQVEPVSTTPVTASDCDGGVDSETEKQEGKDNMNIRAKFHKTVTTAAVAAMGLVGSASATTVRVGTDSPTLAAAVAAACAAGEGSVVEVPPGDYPQTATVAVTAPITIRGTTGKAEDVVVWADRGAKGTQKFSVFKITGAGAVLQGLTITNGYSSAANCGGGVWTTVPATIENCRLIGNTGSNGAANLEGGVIRNSVVSGNYGISGGQAPGLYVNGAEALVEGCHLINNVGEYKNGGLGVTMNGGTIRGCVVSNNFNWSGQYLGHTGGIKATGACLIENCLVVDNGSGYGSGFSSSTTGNEAAGVTIWAQNCTVTVRNCTIAGNCGSSHGGFRDHFGTANLENTIVWGNMNLSREKTRTETSKIAMADQNVSNIKKAKVTNICTTLDFGTGSVTADPLFVDPVHGDYRLSQNSPCRGAGLVQEGDETAVDLAGNPRLSPEGKIDMGCYQSLGTEPTVTPPEIEQDVYLTPDGDIHAALAKCGDGSTLHLADGAYAVKRTLLVERGVKIVSANGPSKTSLCRCDEEWSGVSSRLVVGDHADFLLSGVTISNIVCKGTTLASAVFVRDGTVSNCVFRDNNLGTFSYGGGIVRVFNGKVLDCAFINNKGGGSQWGNTVSVGGTGSLLQGCVISNNVCTGNKAGGHAVHLENGSANRCRIVGNTGGVAGFSGLYIENGVSKQDCWVENCLIADNTCTYSTTTAGGGIRVNQDGNVRVDNCTVANNSADVGAGLAANGKTVACVNTIFSGNVSAKGASTSPDLDSTAASTFVNCFFTLTDEIGANCTDCKAGDPLFVSAETGDYALQGGSVCRDTGKDDVTWLDDPPIDLAGAGRVNGEHVDRGCLEFYAGASLSCTYTAEGFDIPGDAVTFTATPDGSDLDGVQFRWKLDTVGGAEGEWTAWSSQDTLVRTGLAPAAYRMTLEVKNAAGEQASSDMDGAVYFVTVAKMYLAADAGSAREPVPPYVTEETAATNLSDLVDFAGTGTEIVVLDGAHALTETVVFPRAVNLHSKGGSPETASLYRPAADDKLATAVKFPLLRLNAVGSELSGLTLSNGYCQATGDGMANAYVAGASVSNCVFTHGHGAAVVADSSVIRQCVFRDNAPDGDTPGLRQAGTNAVCEGCLFTANSGARYCTGSVRVNGGTIRRCQIVDNDMPTSEGAGVCIGGDATVEDCLIARNRTGSGAGGIGVKAEIKENIHATVVNCTVVSNVCGEGGIAGGVAVSLPGSMAKAALAATNLIVRANVNQGDRTADEFGLKKSGSVTVTFANCLCSNLGDVNSVTNCFYADPLFRDLAAGNYRLRASSPCVDAGASRDLEPGATDLSGRPRVKRYGIDLGCYENQSEGLVLMVR